MMGVMSFYMPPSLVLVSVAAARARADAGSREGDYRAVMGIRAWQGFARFYYVELLSEAVFWTVTMADGHLYHRSAKSSTEAAFMCAFWGGVDVASVVIDHDGAIAARWREAQRIKDRELVEGLPVLAGLDWSAL